MLNNVVDGIFYCTNKTVSNKLNTLPPSSKENYGCTPQSKPAIMKSEFPYNCFLSTL